MLRVIKAYNFAILSHPTLVNSLTGGGLAFTGDVFCQSYLEGPSPPTLSWPRALSMTAFGAFYSGGICVRVFSIYPGITPAVFKGSAFKSGAWASMLDNFVHVPLLYTPAFYAITISVREFSKRFLSSSDGPEEDVPCLIVQTMKEKYKETVVMCWAMWIPLQTVTFSIGESQSLSPFGVEKKGARC